MQSNDYILYTVLVFYKVIHIDQIKGDVYSLPFITVYQIPGMARAVNIFCDENNSWFDIERGSIGDFES